MRNISYGVVIGLFILAIIVLFSGCNSDPNVFYDSNTQVLVGAEDAGTPTIADAGVDAREVDAGSTEDAGVDGGCEHHHDDEHDHCHHHEN